MCVKYILVCFFDEIEIGDYLVFKGSFYDYYGIIIDKRKFFG